MGWYLLSIKLHDILGDKLEFHSYWVGDIKHELIYDDGIHKKEIKAERFGSQLLDNTYQQMYDWLIENKLIEKLPEMGAK